MKSQVAWQDGLLLEAKHFQAEQSFLARESQALTQLSLRAFSGESSAYGLLELSWDEIALSQGHLSLHRCLAVFPDGSLFSYSEAQQQPVTLRLDPATQNQIIFLSLEGVGEHGRFERSSVPGVIPVEQLSPKLGLSPSNQVRSTHIHIAKLKLIDKSGLCFDSEFIPEALCIGVLPGVLLALEKLSSRVQQIRALLLERLSVSGHGQALGLREYLILSLLSRYHSRLHCLSRRGTACSVLVGHLREFECELSGLLGLGSFKSDELGISILDQIERLLMLHEQIGLREAVAVSIQKLGNGFAWVEVPEVLSQKRWILSLPNRIEAAQVESLSAHIKFASESSLRQLLSRQLSGLVLTLLHKVPDELLVHSHQCFLELKTSGVLWDQIVQSKRMAMYMPEALDQIDWQLWVVG